jgi:hypothetical protein
MYRDLEMAPCNQKQERTYIVDGFDHSCKRLCDKLELLLYPQECSFWVVVS